MENAISDTGLIENIINKPKLGGIVLARQNITVILAKGGQPQEKSVGQRINKKFSPRVIIQGKIC